MAHRSELIIATGALLFFGGAIASAAPQPQSNPQTSAQQSSQSQSQNDSGNTTLSQPVQQPVSLGDAARKAREQNKNAHTAKTYSNDDLPTIRSQGISTVGQPSDATPAATAPTPGAATKPADDTKSEQYWRKRFAVLRTKIADTQKEADVLQRELNLAQREFYNDPNMALQQQHSRDEINAKTEKIDAKKKQLDDLNQQLSDLQDELRRAGGDPDWGR